MWRQEDGQSLVEFALVLPLIIALLIGMVDFGRVLYTHQELELITQEAVRIGSFGESDEAISSYVTDNFDSGNPAELSVTVTPENRSSGEYMTVETAYPASIFNLLGDYSIPYTIETNSTIRVE
ncbi:Flp pilus assembly protein TadG [Marinococcus luteus]|uniref:Flp pilus assembly protein TadG n=1 Tax=Marinococcus luteus TaxID=1122204 RepID=A0A1H2XR87_9BACI|nr:TadE/TadG family type IV pilus assembly protein [Marinococcus luteus]SDW95316.1 Flp pilus assembly protein TadG [Marinococcus luteus]